MMLFMQRTLHKGRSELMWIVGNARQFNAHGATPTNTTRRDILRQQDENDWRQGEVIRLLASLAALFHDFGKANAQFQNKLRRNRASRDAYRHEWISLRLFSAFVADARDDETWLNRLATLQNEPEDWEKWLIKDGLDIKAPAPLKSLPPLAKAVGWLILSHHRLPVDAAKLPERLDQVENRFKPAWCGADPDATAKAIEQVWQLEQSAPWSSAHWRRHAARVAREMLKHPGMGDDWLGNPHVAHLARLALMLADHYYSGEPSHARYGDRDYPLYANTGKQGNLKQRLDEHLIGVEVNASRIVRGLPRLERELPRIAGHRGFRKRTTLDPFKWQNRAFDLAEGLRERTARQGFFGINMASTGTGKTLANGRILYGLSNQALGARFTVALGLRILTLQTGQAYRERLHLGEDELAILVGGGAARELYEKNRVDENAAQTPAPGSESAQSLFDEDQYIYYEGSLEDGPLNRWLDGQAKKLLMAPIATCTIDHLAPATEGIRGGRQILPMLRLMTSDLVIDEVDDFDVA
ncbi:TPA: type I-F CRISPR-associated helicase Cas3, partial [Candidatus Micrarchaeota archaeon]|nr:type I-F CRISPR-associated helicase Cas3 [Candidatus Micrarchaeota archaeon]